MMAGGTGDDSLADIDDDNDDGTPQFWFVLMPVSDGEPPQLVCLTDEYEGWVTSYGVCGHLLDSLSARGHSATLFKGLP